MEWSGRRARRAVLTCPASAGTNLELGGRRTWGRLVGKALAKAFPFLLARGSSRRVWARRFVGSEPEGVIVKLEATMFMNSPRERARGMMRKLEQSLCESSGPPTLQRWASPGAENSTFENTSPTVEKALMLKSPPMKSTSCRTTWAWRRCKRDVAALLFLATECQ